jgi:hypothetical protein
MSDITPQSEELDELDNNTMGQLSDNYAHLVFQPAKKPDGLDPGNTDVCSDASCCWDPE